MVLPWFALPQLPSTDINHWQPLLDPTRPSNYGGFLWWYPQSSSNFWWVFPYKQSILGYSPYEKAMKLDVLIWKSSHLWKAPIHQHGNHETIRVRMLPVSMGLVGIIPWRGREPWEPSGSWARAGGDGTILYSYGISPLWFSMCLFYNTI